MEGLRQFNAWPIDIVNSADRAKIRLAKLKERENITPEETVEIDKQIAAAEYIPDFLANVFGAQEILKNSPEFLEAVKNKNVDEILEVLTSLKAKDESLVVYFNSIIRDLPKFKDYDEVWNYFKWNLFEQA